MMRPLTIVGCVAMQTLINRFVYILDCFHPRFHLDRPV